MELYNSVKTRDVCFDAKKNIYIYIYICKFYYHFKKGKEICINGNLKQLQQQQQKVGARLFEEQNTIPVD